MREASEKELIDGMEESLDIMVKTGTGVFSDFREDGIIGICLLKTALDLRNISSVILSRPDSLIYHKNEMDILLNSSDGIGLSAISDWNMSELKKIVKHTKSKKKFFALHASERIREDIDLILDLKPDFLVHMIKATESDLIRVKENNIPIVLCPRSNAFYNLKPDFDLLKNLIAKVDYVFNMAALPRVPRSISDPIGTHKANVTLVLYLLQACREVGVKKFIQSSSSSVYGIQETNLMKEDMQPNPQNPYALQKLQAEEYCLMFNKLFDVPVVILRYFNVWGPRMIIRGPYSLIIGKYCY